MLTWRLTANCKDTDNELTLCLTIEIFCWNYFLIAIDCFLFSIKHIFVLHLRLKLLLNEKFGRTCQPECNICKVLLTKIAIIIKNALIKHSFDYGMFPKRRTWMLIPSILRWSIGVKMTDIYGGQDREGHCTNSSKSFPFASYHKKYSTSLSGNAKLGTGMKNCWIWSHYKMVDKNNSL